MKQKTNANVVVTNSKGEFLVIKETKGPFKGRYCIPGGGIEPGEFSEDTVVREIKEETGIVVKNKPVKIGYCELIDKKKGHHRIVLLYHVKAEGKPLKTADGEASWISYAKAKKILIPFAIKSINLWRKKHNYFRMG